MTVVDHVVFIQLTERRISSVRSERSASKPTRPCVILLNHLTDLLS